MAKFRLAFISGLGLLLAGTTAYAACTPTVSNTSPSTSQLNSSTDGDCVENSSSITISGLANYGIYSTGANSTVTNAGSITVSGEGGHGIASTGASSTNTNASSITTSGVGGDGIYSTGTNSSNTNSGTITTSGQDGYGIDSTGVSSTNTNSGTIRTSGLNGYGMYSSGSGSTNTNSGSITTSGANSHGMYSTGNNTTNTNSGTITTSGSGSYGMASSGSGITITNSGSITSSGTSSYGIWVGTGGNTINNSGSIRATNTNSAAIYAPYVSTVNLNRGSVIVGDILAVYDAAGVARLNINLGAGVSYAYSVTGPWTVTDLDNRPMVTGSAYAAGIGAQETAAEMLYQRTSAITSALDRRLQAYAADEMGQRSSWLDVYYSDVNRDAGGNYSTQTAFSNHNYGATAGFQLSNEVMPLELIVNVAQSNLNIDSGSQKVNSTSLMVGLLAPDMADVLGATLSAKVMLGYADHDGDRKVMTNSLLYDGSRQIQSDYHSLYGVLGASLTRIYPVTDRFRFNSLLGLDLTSQRVEAYGESDYFAWDHRLLSQLQSRVQAGFDCTLWNQNSRVFAQVGAEHRGVIGGAGQGYSMNGSHVSFNSNNKTDTYLTAQLGLEAQLEKRIHLFGTISTLHSDDSVNSVSGSVGIRVDF